MKELKIDLLPLINKLDAVLKRGFSREWIAGSYKSVYRGKGMEFVGYREYVPADDAMLIDWKASLRAHKPVVRILEEERDLNIFFLFDVSDSMLFSSHSKLKCEYAAELIATLAFAMHEVGDNVGLAMFSNKIIKLLPPAMGKNQFYKIVRTLSDPSLYGGKFDMNFALRYLLNTDFVRKDSIVFLVSDFIGLRPGWEDAMKIAGLKYDLSLFIIRDPIDMRLPDIRGEVRFSDPYSSQQMLVDPKKTREEYERAAKGQIAKLQKQMDKTNSEMLMLSTDREFTGEIFKFFRKRQKFRR
ncbi:DUF58 domain-containing protein [Candidatus Woesearchaeota archaeon]|nr:DUF58 domain-containing protein [Candidatus Woesearchaeota archaeon]